MAFAVAERLDALQDPTEQGGAIEEPRGRSKPFRVVEQRWLRQYLPELSTNREFRTAGLLKQSLEAVDNPVDHADRAGTHTH